MSPSVHRRPVRPASSPVARAPWAFDRPSGVAVGRPHTPAPPLERSRTLHSDFASSLLFTLPFLEPCSPELVTASPAMSFGVKLATPTQCAPQTLTWSGPPVRKALGMWVQGTVRPVPLPPLCLSVADDPLIPPEAELLRRDHPRKPDRHAGDRRVAMRRAGRGLDRVRDPGPRQHVCLVRVELLPGPAWDD